MEDRVYPAEAAHEEQRAEAGVEATEVLRHLKDSARAAGLWNLFLPGGEWGAGLSNVEYAPLAEMMGRSIELAPEATNCSAPPGQNLENYYSFHYILDDDWSAAGQKLTVELRGSDNSSSPFWRPGWTGILGNNRLDPATIKGFRLELNVDSQGEVGSLVSGSVALGNLTTADAVVAATPTLPAALPKTCQPASEPPPSSKPGLVRRLVHCP